jgi:arginine deiminase
VTTETFGVHSEVGALRKVMVHRPELSLQRLTPTNHDDLLFDDVLWVERAQYEHDRFVELMRGRGIEVYLFQELLAEALGASEEGRRRMIELVASEYTVGISLVDEVRSLLWALGPSLLAAHLIGGMTVAEGGFDPARFRASSLPAAALDDLSTSSCRPCPTRCSRGIPRAGSTAGSRSTRCSGRRGGSRRTTWPRSTGITRCSARRRSRSGTRSSVTTTG